MTNVKNIFLNKTLWFPKPTSETLSIYVFALYTLRFQQFFAPKIFSSFLHMFAGQSLTDSKVDICEDVLIFGRVILVGS